MGITARIAGRGGVRAGVGGPDRAAAAAPDRRGPLDDLTPRALAALARRADRARRRDVRRLDALAAAHGIEVRQLRLLADAWQAGGASGVAATGPAVRVDPWLMARAEEVVETWRRRHRPLDALQTQVWRNRLTVHRLVPGVDRTGPAERVPLMDLRRTADGRWHLFRPSHRGGWWPVPVRGRRGRQPLSACLDAVRVDALGQFWGDGST